MGRRNKLLKFSELRDMPNVYQNFTAVDPEHIGDIELMGKDGIAKPMKGKWGSHFGNDNPITLELACGRGEYSIALAKSYPDRNFIGVDIKGARIWQGAKIAVEAGLDNVAFLRTRIEMIHYLFAQNEIDEIWITFPDPFLRESKSNKRLTSMRFMDLYKEILRENGVVQLKTDDDTLYDFTIETWSEEDSIDITYQNGDIYAKELDFSELDHKTYYEKMHLKNGLTIKYVRCTFKVTKLR